MSALPAAPAAVCAALAVLAERELTLVQTGAYEALEDVHERRVALLDALGPPGRAGRSEGERACLRDAARLQQLANEAMRQRRDELARELGHNGQARRAVAGYRASTAT